MFFYVDEGRLRDHLLIQQDEYIKINVLQDDLKKLGACADMESFLKIQEINTHLDNVRTSITKAKDVLQNFSENMEMFHWEIDEKLNEIHFLSKRVFL